MKTFRAKQTQSTWFWIIEHSVCKWINVLLPCGRYISFWIRIFSCLLYFLFSSLSSVFSFDSLAIRKSQGNVARKSQPHIQWVSWIFPIKINLWSILCETASIMKPKKKNIFSRRNSCETVRCAFEFYDAWYYMLCLFKEHNVCVCIKDMLKFKRK